MSVELRLVYDITEGPWRVMCSYTGEGQDAFVTFWHNGEHYQSFDYPAYKVWNIAAHLHDIVADFEHGMAVASSTLLEGLAPGGESDG